MKNDHYNITKKKFLLTWMTEETSEVLSEWEHDNHQQDLSSGVPVGWKGKPNFPFSAKFSQCIQLIKPHFP